LSCPCPSPSPSPCPCQYPCPCPFSCPFPICAHAQELVHFNLHFSCSLLSSIFIFNVHVHVPDHVTLYFPLYLSPNVSSLCLCSSIIKDVFSPLCLFSFVSLSLSLSHRFSSLVSPLLLYLCSLPSVVFLPSVPSLSLLCLSLFHLHSIPTLCFYPSFCPLSLPLYL
jgi:hypothetical protein